MPGSPGAESLSAADASNVVLDAVDQVNVFLMAGILSPGGFVDADGHADLERLRSVVADRLADPSLAGLRRFSQRVGGKRRQPVWEASAPDLDSHVREVEPVAGTEGLAAMCASLMTTPLPAGRPLWELLLVPGAADGGTGIILRIHHAVADGVAGVRLAQQLFDQGAAPESAAPPRPRVRTARARKSRWRRVWGSLGRLAAMFSVQLGPTALLGPISPRRGITFGDVALDDFAAGARTAGGTVNDGLLAAVAAGAAAALTSAGEPVPEELPASIPVALPDRGSSGNAVGVMMVPLPLSEPDLAARISRIARVTTDAKAEAREQGTYELTRSRWGTRVFAFLARRQRFIALFVTNVRGPERRLSLDGAPLERAWPVTPIQGNVRLGVSAISYAGRLECVAHVDAGALDAHAVERALEDDLARICELGLPSLQRNTAPDTL
ncbi:MAG TPA: wax ester/triacylglycerol synthase domain-containing protein [Propionicimonas sp.]|nr:wax ester/triacylglycerol synthase domain-containing protein [Propionicimonas sp.]